MSAAGRRWVRTAVTKCVDTDDYAIAGVTLEEYEPGDPVAILPAADLDELVGLLVLARSHVPASSTVATEIDRFLATHTEKGTPE